MLNCLPWLCHHNALTILVCVLGAIIARLWPHLTKSTKVYNMFKFEWVRICATM
ncbi:hypothetical protein SLEP1_g27520 [Rubroshorea leprosula]|uniref:Uncharacterized protein n=1 Tax=Rubroshorea leprosula TaxID=152421 RepID=A0AAV5JQP8_9ROSI|nr:hypothetical protein SLEP1_g27520 [Rubroshorea leprosula]